VLLEFKATDYPFSYLIIVKASIKGNVYGF